MRCVGDDEQLLVLGVGIGFAYKLVTFGMSVNHVVIGRLAEVARVSICAMHHEDGRTYLVDVVEETAVGVGLSADDAPSVVRVAAALVVAALGLVVIVIVMDEVGRLWRHAINHPASHRIGVGEALLGENLAVLMASLLDVESVVVVVAADARHVVHRRGHCGLDARVGCRSVEGNAAPAADADDANAVCIYIFLFRQEIDSSHEVLGIDVGRGCATRLTAALAGIGRVEGQCHKAALGHPHSIQAARLLLGSTERTGNGDGGPLSTSRF